MKRTMLGLVMALAAMAALPGLAGTLFISGEQAEKFVAPEKGSTKPAATAALAVAPVVAQPQFSVLPADMNVRGTLRRWMKVAGYQDVVWDLRDDIPADRELTFDGDLNAALLGLMQALKTGPSPARACVHTNRVVRIIPATRFCEEPSL